jgi:uncharacterized protein (DUF302 family)
MDQQPGTSPPFEQSGHPRALIRCGPGARTHHVFIRSTRFFASPQNKGVFLASDANNGIVCRKSNHSVDETVEKLKSMLQAKGVTLFALVDHSGEAQEVGLTMPPTKLLIFGNPKGGTPLMLATPSIAIDLPLKILIAQDADGTVNVCYNAPDYVQRRHNLPQELLQNIAVVETLAAKAAD